MLDPEQARLFFQRKLDAELQDVLPRTPKSASDRVNKARTVVNLLMKGSDYNDALELCNELLEIINNNLLTVPLPRKQQFFGALPWAWRLTHSRVELVWEEGER